MVTMNAFTNNSKNSSLFREDGPLAEALRARSEIKPKVDVSTKPEPEVEPAPEPEKVNILRCKAFGPQGLIYANVKGKDVTVKWYLTGFHLKFDTNASKAELELIMNKVLGSHED